MERLRLSTIIGFALIIGLLPLLASAATGKGSLYHNGAIVGTTVTPSPIPTGTGTDPIYAVTNGVEGQLGIAGVAPGDGPYHGGSWAVYTVTFNVSPYLLTSDEAVTAAAAAGDVTVVRVLDKDFRCPVTMQNQ